MPYNDIFISYGRKESKDFARKLHDRLVSEGFSVWFDQEDIPLGVDFQDQIDEGITSAHNFIFIIAPHAIDSPYCGKEIELAHAYNKRIIPILHVPPKSVEQEKNLHPAIQRINWTPFVDNSKFEESYSGLVSVVKTHKHFVETHTELLLKAINWKKHNFENALLLVGEGRKKAEKWLSKDFGNEQHPCVATDLHCSLITESKKNAQNLHTDIFLSESESDEEKAKEIRLLLQRKGITTWWAQHDLKAGMKERSQKQTGIEQADNFVILLSEKSISDPEKAWELEYAASLNKRIVPILTSNIVKEKRPAVLRDENAIRWQGIHHLEEFLSEIATDKDYLNQHTRILVASLKWKEQNYNQSILFRGFNLNLAEDWLRIAKKRQRQQPTELQEKFVEESSQKGGSLPSEVFIAYSRADVDFTRKVNSELQIHGKTTWFDQENIAPTADFQEEIFKGIKNSDNFVFVITERSLVSPYCDAELQYAQQLNKRFITILWQQVDTALLPPALASQQWIDFRPDQREFHVAFSELLRALDTDREHVAAHTRWAQAAEKWEANEKPEDLLLRGMEFQIASAWLQTAHEENKSPQATPLQIKYIEESKSAIAAYNRRKKMAAIRLRIMAIIMAVLAVAAFIMAGWTFALRERALDARIAAEKAQSVAELQKKNAELAKTDAEQARIVADNKREEAETAKQNAQDNFLRAERERKAAVRARKKAQENFELATKERSRAERNAEEALKQERKANKNANLAQQRMIESKAITYIAKAREVETDNPTLAMHLALAAKKIFPNSLEVENTIRNIYYKNNFYHQFASLKSSITSVEYSPNGKYIGILTQDNQMELWNTFGEKVQTLWGHQAPITSLSFTPNSTHVVTGSLDKTVRIWDIKTGKGRILGRHDGIVTDVCVSPTKPMIASASADKNIRLWSFEGRSIPFIGSHKEAISSIAFSPNGKYILSGSVDKTAILWKLSGRKKEKLNAHHGPVSAVAFSPDGKYMATGSYDRDIIVWNMDGEVHALMSGHELGINDIAFSKDSRYLISASKDKTARLWALAGEELQLFKGHKEEVTSVAFAPDDNFILSASADNDLKIWLVNTDAQQVLRAYTPTISAFSFSDAGYIAASNGGEKIFLLDDNASKLRTLDEHDANVTSLCFSPSARYLASGDESGILKLWSMDGKEMKSIETGSFAIQLLRITPDGKYILVGTTDGKMNLWTTDGWVEKRYVGLISRAVDADFSSSGKLLLAVGAEGTATIWDDNAQTILKIPPQNGGVTACRFSKTSTDFLLGFSSGVLRMYDIKGNSTKVFGGHTNAIRAIDVASDNKTFVSASDDRTARLWDIKGNQLQIYSGHKDIIDYIALNKSRKSLLTASKDNTIRRWHKSISFDEYKKDYGFGKLPIADQLEYGLLDFDELKKSSSADDLIAGGNYYLAKAVSYDEEQNLYFRQNSIILIARAVRKQPNNVALKQRLAGAYHNIAWDYLARMEYGKARTSAKLAYDSAPEQQNLAVRYATTLLYQEKWADAKALYETWMQKNNGVKNEFLNEILRLENLDIYARYRRQAKEILE